MRRSRRGFTLLEMLGVISIILILVGLAVIGFETLDKSASGKQTRVMLNACTAMLNEFEAEGGASGLSNLGAGGPEDTYGFPYPAGIYAGGPLGYNGSTTNYVEVTSMANSTTFPPLTNPANETNAKTEFGRYGTAVQYTWWVMANLMRVPKVRQMVQNLPPNRLLTGTITSTGATVPWYPGFNGTATNPNSSTVTPGAGVVLLDGWGNPIIFVPSGGINVWNKGQSSYTTIKSKDGRPFFASAGPDSDFGADNWGTPIPNPNTTATDWLYGSSTTNSTTMLVPRAPMGDDNIYSFENGQ